MNFNINISNVVRVDLRIDSFELSMIECVYKMKPHTLSSYLSEGYTQVWLEKYNGGYRLIAYSRGSGFSMTQKLINNVSQRNVDLIFSIPVISTPSKSEYDIANESRKSSIEKKKDVKKAYKPFSKAKRESKVESKIESKKVVRKKRKVKEEASVELTVDNVLDKISKSGMSSLTKLELKFLNDESKKS